MSYCPTCLRYVNGAVSCPGCGILASELDQTEPEAIPPRPPSFDVRPLRLSHAGDDATRTNRSRARPRRKPLIVTALAAATLTVGLAAASSLGILTGQSGPQTSSTPPGPNSQDPQAGSLPRQPAAANAQSVRTSARPTPSGNAATRTTTPSASPVVPTSPPAAAPVAGPSRPAASPTTASPAPTSPTSSPSQTTPPWWPPGPSPSPTHPHDD